MKAVITKNLESTHKYLRFKALNNQLCHGPVPLPKLPETCLKMTSSFKNNDVHISTSFLCADED